MSVLAQVGERVTVLYSVPGLFGPSHPTCGIKRGKAEVQSDWLGLACNLDPHWEEGLLRLVVCWRHQGWRTSKHGKCHNGLLSILGSHIAIVRVGDWTMFILDCNIGISSVKLHQLFKACSEVIKGVHVGSAISKQPGSVEHRKV